MCFKVKDLHMRKSIIIFIIVLLALPLSCDTDFLETTPVGSIPSETTWTDGPLSQAFVFGIYSFLGYGGFEEQMLAAYTDEAMFTHAGRSINTFTEGTESPSNLAWHSATYEWDDMFNAIRAANTAIINLPTATFEDPSISKDMLLGEAYFLRAYYNHQLLRFYGAFPIITELYDIDSDYQIPRNTFEECVDFIVADLNQAATLLDGKSFIRGRANKLAALALKSRVLLYAASDLHDMTTASANSAVLSSYATKDLVGYTSGDQNTRWLAAKDAAKAVLDATTGYKLDLLAPVSPEEGTANYVALSMGGGSNVADKAAGVELLFERTHTPLYTVENNWPLGGIHFGINNGPNGYHNWAGNTPIQQLVDDYEVMDGGDAVEFDWNNPTHAAAPYADRDPRFYATILFDGSTWKPRPSDVAGIDPVNQIQTGYYDNGSGGLINGVDTRESAIENWNGSRTHYYTRKFIDPDPAIVENQSGAQVVPWPFIRYTEVILNYVEASIELGEEDEARAWLNKIRFRAGMPEITATGGELMEKYRNERRIELVYEEHRYHDARRWMIADETLGRGIKSIHIEATLKAGQSPHVPYRYDPAKYDYDYTVEDNTSNEVRTWVDKMYYRPIPRNEININTALVQNPGYE
jgi:starch-binding outer membrane protein, SusD/RagB family